MFFISDIYTTAPASFQTPLQEKVYQTLEALAVPYERVETDEAITMEDCVQINQKLDMQMVKTLFLCNRQQTAFYLFITTGDKPFKARDFSAALGVPRVSFAPPERMAAMLGTKIGAATVFSTLLDPGQQIRVVVDRDVAAGAWYGCSDGTTTGYMKLETRRILQDFLPWAAHTPALIEV
ncbi:YbaK/EbsC family protein [Eubacterium sp. 1001713B170207_170306_E7]|uniref:prolyl-tRNA synthetase associated domain-containing protein n=1 Tax=Eubacterium sp. 1001713B170207_170306_E7 TaxID=2787097 RepID=UPI001899F943|nr:YbaK/EbsC family protein [Eubacterium sp. 1001713B170207_170306_E7]